MDEVTAVAALYLLYQKYPENYSPFMTSSGEALSCLLQDLRLDDSQFRQYLRLTVVKQDTESLTIY